jgi:hypothetical protein
MTLFRSIGSEFIVGTSGQNRKNKEVFGVLLRHLNVYISCQSGPASAEWARSLKMPELINPG